MAETASSPGVGQHWVQTRPPPCPSSARPSSPSTRTRSADHRSRLADTVEGQQSGVAGARSVPPVPRPRPRSGRSRTKGFMPLQPPALCPGRPPLIVPKAGWPWAATPSPCSALKPSSACRPWSPGETRPPGAWDPVLAGPGFPDRLLSCPPFGKQGAAAVLGLRVGRVGSQPASYLFCFRWGCAHPASVLGGRGGAASGQRAGHQERHSRPHWPGAAAGPSPPPQLPLLPNPAWHPTRPPTWAPDLYILHRCLF